MVRCLLLLTVLAAVAAGQSPRLVFDTGDLPRLRAACRSAALAPVWDAIKARADAMITPGDPGYADPEQVDRAPQNVKLVVLGHSFGRRLTDAMETLGFAWQITGDERYARHGIKLLTTFAQRLPVTDPRVAPGFAGARGDICRGLAIGLDWLGGAMPADERKAVETVAAAYVRNLLEESRAEKTWWRPYHNFMGVAGGAAGCLSVVLADAFPAEAPGWTEACRGLVNTWLDRGWDDQGAYFEGALYGAYGLSNSVLFLDALRRRGVDGFAHPHLLAAPRFYAAELLPGERVYDARNDSNYDGLGDPALLRLAGAQRSGLARWVWDQSGNSASPLRIVWDTDVAPQDPVAAGVPLGQRFAGRGLCVFRTGWTSDDVMLAVEAGPFHPVTHNQGDKGSFTLYGLGQRWAIDSGYGNNRLPGGRDDTVAHNAILIDGRGQAPSGAGAGTDGAVLAFADTPRFGYALTDATPAYTKNSAGQPGPAPKRAWRYTVLIRPRPGVPAYAVVVDDVEQDGKAHDFIWLLHTAATNLLTATPGGATAEPVAARERHYVETPADATGRGEAVWTVDLPRAGKVGVWARVRAGGPELGKSDSFLVSVDDAPPVNWHMPSTRDWTWGRVSIDVEHQPWAPELPAGKHRLRFLTREPGAQVDLVALLPDAATEPDERQALPATAAAVTAPMRLVTLPAEPSPRLRVWLSATAPLRAEVATYDGHPRLAATCRAALPGFAAVLAPLPVGCAEPSVTVARTAEAVRVKVAWAQGADVLTLPGPGRQGVPTLEPNQP